MKYISFVLACFFLIPFKGSGQNTITYGGRGIKPYQIISSDQAKLKDTPDTLKDDSAMDGTGMDYNWYNMGRLMRQATLGVNFNDMKEFVKMTPEKWIDEQMKVTSPNMLEKMLALKKEADKYVISLGYDFKDDTVNIRQEYFNMTWWDHNLNNSDYLKQRLAYALSQILVISQKGSDVGELGYGTATYYDLLLKNINGNFKELLLSVSLHPSMGIYLSHFNNSKSIPERNIQPDENYAREIMQLFSIGLHQLNIDGSLKRDSLGNPIPTYTQKDIKELAKVFTGLSAGKAGLYSKPDKPVHFGFDRYQTDFTVPMAMFEEWHEFGGKSFLGLYIPSGQKGMKDIEMAVDHIFRHPNVGPFIGKQLIQKLVTSNPSPAYIRKVAETFNDNGKGVRGDMSAVFKAILMYQDARSCESIYSPIQGKLQEPLVRMLERIRNFKFIPDANNKIYIDGQSFFESFSQNIFSAPSVFNFFQPNYSPIGDLSNNNLLGPEFQIHNSTNSINWVNTSMSPDGGWINYWWRTQREGRYELDISELNVYSNDFEALLNQLDKRLTRGQLSTWSRNLIKFNISRTLRTYDRVSNAIGLVLFSPEFNILK
jgi:uncharacterized protein (DUF1800 family)